MSIPGKIRLPWAQRVIRDYSALNFEGATPTDIDGFIWLDPWFFFLELKYNHAQIYDGQRRAFEKLAAAVGQHCVFIIADHFVNASTPDVEIDAAHCVVRRWYNGGTRKWEVGGESEQGLTVRDFIDAVRQLD